MFFLALMIFGLISAFSMSVNLFPNVSIPLIKITSKINGDLNFVESKVTKEIENALSEIDGVKTITSAAYDNFSVSVVEFKLGKNLEVAANDVRDKIGTLSLPSKPEIEKSVQILVLLFHFFYILKINYNSCVKSMTK